MKRRLFNLAAAVSLVMMLAMVALWVRSYWRSYGWTGAIGTRVTDISVERGIIFLERVSVASRSSISEDGWVSEPAATTAPYRDAGTVRDWKLLGFSWFMTNGGVQTPASGPDGVPIVWVTRPRSRVGIPLWLLVLISSLAPMRWWLRHRRAPAPSSFCRRCGYDLRATPERCPECGTAAGTAAAAGEARRA
jgi:hypothetical protein